MALKLYNTLTKKEEEFIPLKEHFAGIYTCGPTVYDYAHIGNLRAYVFADILRRTLKYEGYKVTHVINITDVGHLVSDGDDGEDKMTKALKREGKPLTLGAMKEIADFYTERFTEDLSMLNIESPEYLPKASEHIKEDIELISKLQENGFVYKTSDGLYFDTSKLSDYGKLVGPGKVSEAEEHSRIGENSQKKSQRDFSIWKFDSALGYESPFGKGFPGWHIECSAMSMKYLGETFDIHTGGIDHIPIHHTNEIAQSEAATGKPFVHYWLHNNFLNIEGDKISKSTGNTFYLRDIISHGISPISYRYFLLMAHYRSFMNFNWEAVKGADIALKRLYGLYLALGDGLGEVNQGYQGLFKKYMENDLDTPRALTILWDVLKDEKLSNADKRATVLSFDKVLGLGFSDLKELGVPEEVKNLAKERDDARAQKKWERSDELRKKIEEAGYEVKDTSTGHKIHPKL